MGKEFTWRYSTALLASLMTSACGVDLMDHTAREFPWSSSKDRRPWSQHLYPGSSPFDPNNTYADIFAASTDGYAQMFLLEVRPDRGVSNLSAVAFVEGQSYRMKEYEGSNGKGLFVYQPVSPDCEKDAVSYSYLVRYRAGSQGWKQKRLPASSNDGPLVARVYRGGPYVWLTASEDAADLDPAGEITISILPDETSGKLRIVLQNMSPSTYRIASLDLAVSGENVDKFSLDEYPHGDARVLSCQEVGEFLISWHPNPPDFTDRAVLVLKMEYLSDTGQWRPHGDKTMVINTKRLSPPI